MVQLSKVRVSDILKVNGEEFQVISNTGLFYDVNEKNLEMVVELVKLGESKLKPMYRLTYFYGNPSVAKFFRYSNDKCSFIELKLDSLEESV